MSDDTDYSTLPLEERLVHKVWKVRLQSYEEITKSFQNSRNESDPCFQYFNSHPDIVKKIVMDSNVVAQETGIAATIALLEYGGTPMNITKFKNCGIVSAICEKGLLSSRAGTKAKSIDVLLLFIELSNNVDPVIEEMLPFLTHRLPKLVAGNVLALTSIVENFGCHSIINPKLIIPSLSKLFAHADRNVRAEATKLTVEMYKWMGDALNTVLFPDLKPVQQKDLTAAFEKVKGEPVEQKRYTKTQQFEIARREEQEAAAAILAASGSRENSFNAGEAVDVEMEEANPPKFDAYDLMDPVDVLSKFPSDLKSRMGSSKWKDRKEALDEVHEVLSKAPKLATDDYSDFVRILVKCMKDANVQVVQLASNCVEFLANGLKNDFSRYVNNIVGPMVERTKEKKPSVAEALNNALDSLFNISCLSEILEDTINLGMKHKTPQVKISATKYLQRCLANTPAPPKSAEVDEIMAIGVKLLSDSQEPVRQASTELIGTLMKITGEREINPFLEKIDDNRKNKVKAFYETVTIKAKAPKAAPPRAAPPTNKRASMAPKASSAKPTATNNRASIAGPPGGLTKPKVPSGQTIPSKRSATSPAKRVDDNQKVASSARSLTGRSLLSSNAAPPAYPSQSSPQAIQEQPAQPQPTPQQLGISQAERDELNSLRNEKQQWLNQREQQLHMQEQFQNDKLRLNHEVATLKQENEMIKKAQTNTELMSKQKDTQIVRLKSDLDSSKLKVRDLEQTIEMIKLQQKQQLSSQQQSPSIQNLQTNHQQQSPRLFNEQITNNDVRQSIYSPDRQFFHPRISSGELSSRVNRLSIDGSEAFKENLYSPSGSQTTFNRFQSSPLKIAENANKTASEANGGEDLVTDEESWKRAAEVTSQLKARIEKMKARSRHTNNKAL